MTPALPVVELAPAGAPKMLAGPHQDRRVSAMLVAMVIISVGLRLVSAITQGDAIVVLPGVQDQVSYNALAQRVLTGHGFSFATDWWPATRPGEPTAHWSFLYTLYLAGVYALFGVHPLAARVIQAVAAGVLFPWLSWRLGRRLFGVQIGLIAAALSAVYGYFVYYAGALMTETFYMLAVLWALDLSISLAVPKENHGRSHRVKIWLALGLTLGTAVLLRQLILVFVPVLFGWILWYVGPARRRSALGGVAICTLVVGLLIAPWTVRNYHAFGRFVLLNTNAGYAFFWANHPIQGMNFVSIFPSEVYSQLIPRELHSLDEAALDSALLDRGISFVTNEPLRYAVLSLSRFKDYFEFWPSPNSSATSNIARILSYGLYLPFMLYGLWRAAGRRDRVTVDGYQPAVVLVCLFAAVYSLIHLLSWALVRYRLPVDAIFMPFAAIGVLHLARQISTMRARAIASTSAIAKS